MPVWITALYGAILALLLTALAVNVTRTRAKLRISFGDGGNPQMMRAMRLHGNTAEYVPIGVLLMGLYELDGGLAAALHASGIALIVGRIFYVAGVWDSDAVNFGRTTGVVLTWITIAALAVLNLWQIR